MSKTKIAPQAFTVRSTGGYLGQLITDIGIGPLIDSTTGQPPLRPTYSTKALWDTGCSFCAISDDTASQNSLGLKPISKQNVQFGGGESMEDVFPVTVFLPNNIRVTGVQATACRTPQIQAGQFAPPWGFIVGMAFINNGRFCHQQSGRANSFYLAMSIFKFV